MTASRRLLYTAFAANILDHLDTALYLLLAPVVLRDLLGSDPSALSWSLALPLGGALRVLFALGSSRCHRWLGSWQLLRLALAGVSLCCLGLGTLGLLARHRSLATPISAALYCGLRAMQSLFSMAEASAASTLMLDACPKRQAIASTLTGISSIAGYLAASILCLSLSQIDPTLGSWPWVYLTAGLACLCLLRGPQPSPLPISNQTFRLCWSTLALASLSACFGYSTFYWVSVVRGPAMSSSSYLIGQSQLIGVDLLLLLLAVPAVERFGDLPVNIASSWGCCAVALVSSIGWLDCSCSRWLMLPLGVACAACHNVWLRRLSYPAPFFPYSCLCSAIGYTLGGAALNGFLLLRRLGYPEGICCLPFIIIFGAQASTTLRLARTSRVAREIQ